MYRGIDLPNKSFVIPCAYSSAIFYNKQQNFSFCFSSTFSTETTSSFLQGKINLWLCLMSITCPSCLIRLVMQKLFPLTYHFKGLQERAVFPKFYRYSGFLQPYKYALSPTYNQCPLFPLCPCNSISCRFSSAHFSCNCTFYYTIFKLTWLEATAISHKHLSASSFLPGIFL